MNRHKVRGCKKKESIWMYSPRFRFSIYLYFSTTLPTQFYTIFNRINETHGHDSYYNHITRGVFYPKQFLSMTCTLLNLCIIEFKFCPENQGNDSKRILNIS